MKWSKIKLSIWRAIRREWNALEYEQFRLVSDIIRWWRDRTGKKDAYKWIKLEDL